MTVLEHDLGAPEVRDQRLYRLLDDEPHAHGRGKVVHDVAFVDELVDDRRMQHRVDDEVETRSITEILDVVERSGREIVEHPDLVALIQEQLREV